MGLTELLFGITPVQIKPGTGTSFGVITLDASVRELHRASAKVTRHPVEAEKGTQADVSDHTLLEPLSIQIDGVISNTPAIFGGAVQTQGRDLAQEAHQEFLNKVLTGQLVTVITTLMEYPNMVLEAVEVTREAGKGNALHFTATATQVSLVTLVETQRATARVPTQTTKAKGNAPAKPVTDPQKTSALRQGFDGAKAALGL